MGKKIIECIRFNNCLIMQPAVVSKLQGEAELVGMRKRIRGLEWKNLGHQRQTGSNKNSNNNP